MVGNLMSYVVVVVGFSSSVGCVSKNRMILVLM